MNKPIYELHNIRGGWRDKKGNDASKLDVFDVKKGRKIENTEHVCSDCSSHNGQNFCYSHGNREAAHKCCKDFRQIPDDIKQARDA